jgi:hypothetical protein
MLIQLRFQLPDDIIDLLEIALVLRLERLNTVNFLSNEPIRRVSVRGSASAI